MTTNAEQQNVTLRVPAELVARLDAAVKAESEATGLRIDRSQYIRRALAHVLPELKKAVRKAAK